MSDIHNTCSSFTCRLKLTVKASPGNHKRTSPYTCFLLFFSFSSKGTYKHSSAHPLLHRAHERSTMHLEQHLAPVLCQSDKQHATAKPSWQRQSHNIVLQGGRLTKTLVVFSKQVHPNNLWNEECERGEWVNECVRVSVAAARQGSISVLLMWLQLQGEVIASLWEAFFVQGMNGGKVKEGLDWLMNSTHFKAN